MSTSTSPDEALRGRLSGAHYGNRLRHVDFSGAALMSVATPRLLWLDRCTFAGADLRQATLDGCNFKLCDFAGADLRGASLRGASFAGCDLSDTDLRGADLFDVTFGAVGAGAGARPTTLRTARFDTRALQSARFEPGSEAPGGPVPGDGWSRD